MPDRESRQASTVATFQRARIIAATIAVAGEHDVAGVTVSRVIRQARLSRRTFYELFDSGGDCLRAAFEQIVGRAAARAKPAFEAERRWVDRVRAGLRVTLEFFDEEPTLARLCFLRAPAAGEQTLAYRARLVRSLAEILDEDYVREGSSRLLPELPSQAVVGGVLEILHARLFAEENVELAPLSGQLMAVIVLPYLGPAAARRELAHKMPLPLGDRLAPLDPSLDAPAQSPTRLTYRTLKVLSVISENPGLSNRDVGDRAGIKDQGQISKLLARLCGVGLIENSGAGQALGAVNAWSLSREGRQVLHVGGVPRRSALQRQAESVGGAPRLSREPTASRRGQDASTL
jgi:AcrR family transcriptional regulator